MIIVIRLSDNRAWTFADGVALGTFMWGRDADDFEIYMGCTPIDEV